MEKSTELNWVDILDILKLKFKRTLMLLSLFTILCYIYLSYFHQKNHTAILEIIQTKNVNSTLYDKIKNIKTDYVVSIDELANSLKSIELNDNIKLLNREFKNPGTYQNVKQYFNEQPANIISEKFNIDISKTDEYYLSDYDLIKISLANYNIQDFDSFNLEVENIFSKILNDAYQRVLSNKNHHINLTINEYIEVLKYDINSIETEIETRINNHKSNLSLLLNFLNEQYELAKIIELTDRANIQMTDREPVVFASNLDIFTLSGLYRTENSDTILKRINLSEKKDEDYFKQNDARYNILINRLNSINIVYDNLISEFSKDSFKLSDETFKSQNIKIYTEEESLNKIFILSIFAALVFVMLNTLTLLLHVYSSKKSQL
tara:strand:+ start:1367 stop:2500 length:1134 start_codon:yes stop_codon:yes gene_type:complete